MRVFVWLGTVLVGLLVVAVVAFGAIWFLSDRELNRTYEVPTVSLVVPTDRASIAEGRRLATIRGCYGGCHGRTIEGGVMFDDPKIARITAPNLTASVRRLTDAQLAVAIRNGLWPDGRSMIVMPSEAFVELTDVDVVRIIAFLRSIPPVDGPTARVEPGPLGRVGVVAGQFKTAARLIREAPPQPRGVLAGRVRAPAAHRQGAGLTRAALHGAARAPAPRAAHGCGDRRALRLPAQAARGGDPLIQSSAPAEWMAAVRDCEERARRAFLAGDTAALDALWAADYVVNSPLGRVIGKQEVLELLRSGRIRHHTYEVTIESVVRFGDVAVVMGRDAVTDSPVGAVTRRRYTNVWRLDGAAWRGIARHANPVST